MAFADLWRSLHISKRQFSSYIFDWIVVFCLAGIGGGLSFINPQHRAFSLLDLSLSYPNSPDLVTTTDLFIAALVGPAVIIVGVVLVFVPGLSGWKQFSKVALLRKKFWECHIGLLGLGLSMATAFLITQGTKNIFGKPRPDMLAICMPDLNNIASYAVGGYGQGISDRWVLVDYRICQNTNTDDLSDAFRALPSGHASFSFAGLLYLSLYLCSKFGVRFPSLSPASVLNSHEQRPGVDKDSELLREPVHSRNLDGSSWYRSEASPPVYLLLLLYVPIGAAIYISGTRYFQYKHSGFDVIVGMLVGIFSAMFAFRYYHMPLNSTACGWAWAPRSPTRAWAISVGTSSYVEASTLQRNTKRDDLEMGSFEDGQNKDESSHRGGRQETFSESSAVDTSPAQY